MSLPCSVAADMLLSLTLTILIIKINMSSILPRSELIERLNYLGQMVSTETALFHQAAAAAYGLGITDMKTLSVLMQEGDMTAGQLGKRLSLTSGAITNVIDRLEKRALVRRTYDPDDRRKVIVQITNNQQFAADSAYTSMGKNFTKLLAAYSSSELDFLVRYYEATLEITKKEIAKVAEHTAKNTAKKV